MIRRTFVAAAVPLALTGLLAVGLAQPAQAEVSSTPTTGYPSFDGTVLTMAHRGTTMYVGGEFSHVTGPKGHTFVRNGAAAFDMTTGKVLKWRPSANGVVRRITVGHEGVYLGGTFTTINGKVHNHVAKVALDRRGKLDKRFKVTTNGAVNAIALKKRGVILGGEFKKVNGQPRVKLAMLKRKPKARFKLTAWHPKANNGAVWDIVVVKGAAYVAGEFRAFNGLKAYQRLALVKTTGVGRLVRQFSPKTHNIVTDIARSGGRIYATVGGPKGGGFYAMDEVTGAMVFSKRFDGDVDSVVALGDQIFIGGHFDNVCATASQMPNGDCIDAGFTTRHKGLSTDLDGNVTSWTPWADSTTGILAMDVVGTSLAVGGGFTTLNNGAVPAGHFAWFDSLV